MLYVRRPRALGCTRRVGGDFLIEARERRVEAAREPPGAEDEEPFRVDNVREGISDAPFAWLIGPLRLEHRDPAEEGHQRVALSREYVADVSGRDEPDVIEVVVRCFGRVRPGHEDIGQLDVIHTRTEGTAAHAIDEVPVFRRTLGRQLA